MDGPKSASHGHHRHHHHHHHPNNNHDDSSSNNFNWTLCERAQHLASDCRDVHSLWCETGSVIDMCEN